MRTDKCDLAWAAGFIEGEGSFQYMRKHTIRVSACQVQKEPLTRLLTLFGGTLKLRPVPGGPSRPNWSKQHVWVALGARAAGVMMTLFPFMSPKRKGQIQSAIAAWRSRPPAAKHRIRCPAGHPYAGSNLFHSSDGRRKCRACTNALNRRRYWAKRKALVA